MSTNFDHGARRRPMPPVRPTMAAQILIVLRDSSGSVEYTETVQVARPSDPARQHEQLVRAVAYRFQDARVYRSKPGAIGFTCHSSLITASYIDAQTRVPFATAASRRTPHRSVAPPGSDEAARAA